MDVCHKDLRHVPAPSARLHPTFPLSRLFRSRAHKSLAPPHPVGLPPAVLHCHVSSFSLTQFSSSIIRFFCLNSCFSWALIRVWANGRSNGPPLLFLLCATSRSVFYLQP